MDIRRIARREFIGGLGGAVEWPVVARAQQPATPMIGWLSAGSPDGFASYVVAFRQGLKEIGYVEGQNVNVDYRWAYGDLDRLSTLAMGLVARQVAVIAAAGGSTLAAKNATTTIPIVGLSGGDPVQSGLAASLNRPGGNVTGVVVFANSLGAKRLELLRELTLLWQIIRGTGFPNQIFSDSWVVGLMEGRPWRARGQVGNASLGDGSSLSWSVWVTRRGNGCVRFMWLG